MVKMLRKTAVYSTLQGGTGVQGIPLLYTHYIYILNETIGCKGYLSCIVHCILFCTIQRTVAPVLYIAFGAKYCRGG